jgi:hypothetical protein
MQGFICSQCEKVQNLFNKTQTTMSVNCSLSH